MIRIFLGLIHFYKNISYFQADFVLIKMVLYLPTFQPGVLNPCVLTMTGHYNCTLYRLMPNSWYQQTGQSSVNKLLLILWLNRLL